MEQEIILKDSEGKTYSPAVLDMLARMYRVMVANDLPMTEMGAHRAQNIMGPGDYNANVSKKFIKELEFVKTVYNNQPTANITIDALVEGLDEKGRANGKWVELGNPEVITERTYDRMKLLYFIAGTQNCQNKSERPYGIKYRYTVKNVEEINMNYLVESN